MLSNEQLRRIEKIFADRMRMQPLFVRNPSIQQPAAASQIFELRRTSPVHYYLVPQVAGAPVPPANGTFVYVVPADDPGRIYCGAQPGSEAGIDPRFAVQGHTSLSGRADVLYAGEIQLVHGELLSWNNSSGHYSPPAALREPNLIPALARLLPPERFADVASLSTILRRQRLQARRYVNVD
ncbi:hypothetical protein [Cupriavidus pauculus]|jgi:hypothetical protein|uniref:hypothetical protein n=1 Tax=Cupriavidus pauculus TaxID=82633 RepID=UPI0038573B46